jgi:hypothetical protein
VARLRRRLADTPTLSATLSVTRPWAAVPGRQSTRTRRAQAVPRRLPRWPRLAGRQPWTLSRASPSAHRIRCRAFAAHPIDTPHRHNTTNVSTTIVGRTCAASAAWTAASASVTPGHRYTLNLTSHDDNDGADPTYTLFDDVSLS